MKQDWDWLDQLMRAAEMPALGRAGRHGIEQFAQSKSWRGQIVQSGIPAKSGTAVNCATHGRTSELAPHQARHIYLLRNKTAECRFAVCSKGLATSGSPRRELGLAGLSWLCAQPPVLVAPDPSTSGHRSLSALGQSENVCCFGCFCP